MGLLETIENDLRSALKAGEAVKVSTLRMVKSDIGYEKSKTGKDLTEEKVLEVVSRAAKKRKESITEFDKAGRKDLSDKEVAELVIIEAYLPKQLSEAEIAAVIDKKIAEHGKPAPNEFGKFTGIIIKELKGQADGNVVRKILTEKRPDNTL